MMSKRDILLQISKFEQPDGRILYIQMSREHPDYPVQDDVIRVEIFKVSMVTETPEGDVHSLEFSTWALGGWIPMSFINWLIQTMAAKKTVELRQKLVKVKDKMELNNYQ